MDGDNCRPLLGGGSAGRRHPGPDGGLGKTRRAERTRGGAGTDSPRAQSTQHATRCAGGIRRHEVGGRGAVAACAPIPFPSRTCALPAPTHRCVHTIATHSAEPALYTHTEARRSPPRAHGARRACTSQPPHSHTTAVAAPGGRPHTESHGPTGAGLWNATKHEHTSQHPAARHGKGPSVSRGACPEGEGTAGPQGALSPSPKTSKQSERGGPITKSGSRTASRDRLQLGRQAA